MEIELQEMHFDRVAVVSTAHLCEADGVLILDFDAPYLKFIGAQGACSMFRIPRIREAEPSAYYQEWQQAGFTSKFHTLMASLSERGFNHVCFDRDGPVYPQFEQFDW